MHTVQTGEKSPYIRINIYAYTRQPRTYAYNKIREYAYEKNIYEQEKIYMRMIYFHLRVYAYIYSQLCSQYMHIAMYMYVNIFLHQV